MKRTTLLISCTIFIVLMTEALIVSPLQAQNTSRGRDFYVSFLPNLHVNNPLSDSLYVYVVADTATTGTLSYRNRAGTLFTQNISISNPAVIWQYRLNWSNFELLGYNQSQTFSTNNDLETAAPQVFHIQTDHDVAVYALNKAVTTSDASIVLPTAMLGKDYYVMSYRADGVTDFGGQPNLSYTPSEFCVVATDSNTVVSVHPSAPTTETGNAVKTFTLNAGQAYLFESQFSGTQLNYDLTGTRVQSSKPVAVFGGHQRATIPVELRNFLISRDHLFEEMLPTDVWGKSYVITPLGQPSGPSVQGSDLWRVVAKQDNTVLTFNNVQVANLSAGQYYEASLTTAGMLVASNPVQVALFKKTHSVNQTLEPGDPFMMIIPPRRQYLNKYRFATIASTPQFTEQWITLVTTKTNATNITLDGAALNATFNDIPNSCFSYSNIRVSTGNHLVQSPQPIGLYVYGYGDADSYGYVGGMALQPDVAEVGIDAGQDRDICSGDTVHLKVTGAASGVKWTPSSGLNCDTCVNVVAKPTQTTSYVVQGIDSLGCPGFDTVVVRVRKFQINAGRDTSICPGGDSVKLKVVGVNGSIGTVTWVPKTGLACDTCQTTNAQPTVTTNYIATAYDSTGCVGRDTVKVTVRTPLTIDAGPDQEFCSASDSLTLRVTFSGGVIKRLKWSPSTGLSCDTCQQTKARPPGATTYYVTVFDSTGCSGVDSVHLKLKSASGAVHVADAEYICFKNDSAALQVQGVVMSVKWTPSQGVSCDTCALTFAKPTTTTTYYCDGIDAKGCLFHDSIKVVPLPKATVDIQPDSVICTSGGVALRAMGSFTSIYWTPTDGLSCPNCPTPVATPPKKDIMYYVHVRNGNSVDCEAIDSVMVKYAPGIEGQLPASVSTCIGDTLRYHIEYGGSVQWAPRTYLNCDTCKDVIIVPTGNIKYTISADSAGCTSRATIDIKMSQRATLSAPPDTSICRGDSITLKATSNSTTNPVEWLPHTGLACPTCLVTKASPPTTISYVVTSGTGQCATRDTVTVRVKDRPVAQLSPQDTSLCSGGSVQYNLIVATQGATIRWSPAAGLSDPTIPNPVATPTHSGMNTYTVTLVGPNGCDSSIVATIGVGAPPKDTLLNKDTAFCRSSVVITRVGGDTSATFRWSPSQGVACDTCASTMISPDSSRWYYLVAREASSGCIKVDSFFITVHEPPVIDSITPSQNLCQKLSKQLYAHGGTQYRWSPATGLDRTDIATPVASPTATTTYTVVVSDGFGCSDSASVTLTVQPCGDSIKATPSGTIVPFLACDSADAGIIIRNLGQLAVSIDSISVYSSTNAGVDIVSMKAEMDTVLPKTLQPGETLLPSFTVRVFPLAPGAFRVTLRIWSSNISRVDTVVLSSVGTTLPVLFKLDSTSVPIDSSFAFPIEGVSDYWTTLKIFAVDATVHYASTFMVVDTAHPVAAGNLGDGTWNYSYDPAASSPGTAVYHATGLTPLQPKTGNHGILMEPFFKALLSSIVHTEPVLEYALPSLRVPCADKQMENGLIEVVECAANLRRISVNVDHFQLTSIIPNPTARDGVDIDYSIGFSCDATLSLYDDLGRHVLTVLNGPHESGEYTIHLDCSSLPSGSYHCVLSAAGLQFSKIMNVIR